MATLLLNTSNVAPIPLFTPNSLTIHNPNGVDSVLLKNALYLKYMPNLAISYNARKSTWTSIKDIIALDESDLIDTLTIHCYDADLSEKCVRKFDTTKLVDFMPADLKNMSDYLKVLTKLFG